MSVQSITLPSSQVQSFATHPSLHLRDARDAHIIFEAVRNNTLPLITRRLTTVEREQLASGNVFVWEEAEHKQGGLERWTDGRRWSQSRMRGDYLFYEEKVEITAEERDAKAARRAQKTLDPFSAQPPPTRRQDRPSKPDGLTKQTYSVQVQGVRQEPPRKWHIVAYFSREDFNRLHVIEHYDYLRSIKIPDGVFYAKGDSARLNNVPASDDEFDHEAGPEHAVTPAASSPPRRYSSEAALKLPYVPQSSSHAIPTSPTQYQAGPHSPTRAGPLIPLADHAGKVSLPRLSAVTTAHHAPPPYALKHQSTTAVPVTYSPLTTEDKKALNSFRVVL